MCDAYSVPYILYKQMARQWYAHTLGGVILLNVHDVNELGLSD